MKGPAEGSTADHSASCFPLTFAHHFIFVPRVLTSLQRLLVFLIGLVESLPQFFVVITFPEAATVFPVAVMSYFNHLHTLGFNFLLHILFFSNF